MIIGSIAHLTTEYTWRKRVPHSLCKSAIASNKLASRCPDSPSRFQNQLQNYKPEGTGILLASLKITTGKTHHTIRDSYNPCKNVLEQALCVPDDRSLTPLLIQTLGGNPCTPLRLARRNLKLATCNLTNCAPKHGRCCKFSSRLPPRCSKASAFGIGGKGGRPGCGMEGRRDLRALERLIWLWRGGRERPAEVER